MLKHRKFCGDKAAFSEHLVLWSEEHLVHGLELNVYVYVYVYELH